MIHSKRALFKVYKPIHDSWDIMNLKIVNDKNKLYQTFRAKERNVNEIRAGGLNYVREVKI